MSTYDWKQCNMNVTTQSQTFGVIVPATMYMEIKDIVYANLTAGANQITLRQIPSGNIRPASATVIDSQEVAASSPYSPRIPIRIVQESSVVEASASLGPATVTFAYRLKQGRP